MSLRLSCGAVGGRSIPLRPLSPFPTKESLMDIRASRRRRRLTPVALAAGLIGSAVLGLGATGTFSALTATITNTNNTAGTGSLVMQETNATGTQTGSCLSTDSNTSNSSTCTAFNKYGGSTTLLPGSGTSTATVRIYNIGSLQASQFTIKPLGCTVYTNPNTTSGNICGYLKLTLTCQVTTAGTTAAAVSVYDGALASSNLTQIANTAIDLKTAKACTPSPTTSGGNSYTTFVFSVALDNTADNNVMGQTAKQDIQWTLTA